MNFRVRLAPHFEGSLSELIDKIVRQEIAVADLPLAPLTRQLVAYLEQVPVCERLAGGIDEIGLAARLIRWKSLTCLGGPETPAARIVREELQQELRASLLALERLRLEAVRVFLAARLEAMGGSLEREDQRAAFLPDPPAPPDDFPSLWTLRQKFQWLARDAARTRAAERQAERELPSEPATVEEMIVWVESRIAALPAGSEASAAAWFAEAGSPPRRNCLFLGLLELARRGTLHLAQSEAFAPILAIVGPTASTRWADSNEGLRGAP